MIICVCKCISDREIRSAVASGTATYEGLQCSLGVATQCGSCSCDVKDILQDLKGGRRSCQRQERSTTISKAFPSELEDPLAIGASI